MGKVILNVSMSLDGYIAGPNHSVTKGMGEGGERLHDWMFKEEFKTNTINADVVKEIFDTSGAFLMGRRWFDHGDPRDQPDGFRRRAPGATDGEHLRC